MAKTCSAKLMLSSVACCRVQPTRKRMGMDNPASYNFSIWPPKAGFLKASCIIEYHPATYAREAKMGNPLNTFCVFSAGKSVRVMIAVGIMPPPRYRRRSGFSWGRWYASMLHTTRPACTWVYVRPDAANGWPSHVGFVFFSQKMDPGASYIPFVSKLLRAFTQCQHSLIVVNFPASSMLRGC